MPERPKKLLTTAEVAEELGVTRATVARYAREGILTPALRLPSGHFRWRLDEVLAQMAKINQDWEDR